MKKLFLLLSLIFICGFIFPQQKGIPYPLKEINTDDGMEYAPIISIDGKTLYFTGQDRDDNLGGEDIFISHWKNGKWSKPQLIKGVCTDSTNDAIEAISADQNTMFIFRDGNIFITHRTETGWTEPQEFKELNYNTWNADVSITPDGNAIFFASGVKGFEINIYVIEKRPDGTWSKPKKLDANVNAGDFNRSPFIHPDMKTLYFSSDMEGGYGKLDVYKTTRLYDTSWIYWSKPVNLGDKINTDNYDWGFKVSTDGKTAYYTRSEVDIYAIDLSDEKYKPQKVATLSGIVKDNKGNPLFANIIVKDQNSGKIISQYKSMPDNGYYSFSLQLGKDYFIEATKQGYKSDTYQLNLINPGDDLNFSKDFVLNRTSQQTQTFSQPVVQNVSLRNILFDIDKYNIKPQYESMLDSLADYLKQNPQKSVQIDGHTDSTASEAYNLTLSKRRANSVKNYLLSKGVKQEQIKTSAYGESKPIADNSTEQGRAKNRRVEIKIIEM